MLSIEHFCGYVPDSFANVQHSEKNVLICWRDGSRIKVRSNLRLFKGLRDFPDMLSSDCVYTSALLDNCRYEPLSNVLFIKHILPLDQSCGIYRIGIGIVETYMCGQHIFRKFQRYK